MHTVDCQEKTEQGSNQLQSSVNKNKTGQQDMKNVSQPPKNTLFSKTDLCLNTKLFGIYIYLSFFFSASTVSA